MTAPLAPGGRDKNSVSACGVSAYGVDHEQSTTTPARDASPLRVLVTGGRKYDDAETVARALDAVRRQWGIRCIIHGAARGADMLAARWARTNNIAVVAFPARWGLDGKAAGPIRNARMLREGRPHMVVAFPGGKGTADMVRRSRSAGLDVLEVNP